MKFPLVPDYAFAELTHISPTFLREKGITLLLLDLDNTIAPYSLDTPTAEVRLWAQECRLMGIALFIVSNNRSADRARRFAEALDISFVHRSRKPSRRGLIRAMEIMGKEPKDCALVGDQIYTDVLAANRSGVLSLLVEPIALSSFFLTLRYYAEKPFRALCRNKLGQGSAGT